jgi:hypothetical protein
MSKSEYVEEILKATKDQVKGFDNSRLIGAILNQFEVEVRLDQCKIDQEMVQKQLQVIYQNSKT